VGILTVTYPNGHTHCWRGQRQRNIAAFLDRFRSRILTHVRSDPTLAPQYANATDDNVFNGHVYQMGCWALATPWPDNPQVHEWREMLAINYLLRQQSLDPSHPGLLSELLPDHDIAVKLHGVIPADFDFHYKAGRGVAPVVPDGIDLSMQITPIT
jgi:hypothetical protein